MKIGFLLLGMQVITQQVDCKYFDRNTSKDMSKSELDFVIARLCNHGLRDNINSNSENSIIGPVRTNV